MTAGTFPEFLVKIIRQVRPQAIMEIGVNTGDCAIMMLSEAMKWREVVDYYGFDLFEDITDVYRMRESIQSIPLDVCSVAQRLRLNLFDADQKGKGGDIQLHKGDSRQTVKVFAYGTQVVDLAFIHGGRSMETISSDFQNVAKFCKNIIVDDYCATPAPGFGFDEILGRLRGCRVEILMDKSLNRKLVYITNAPGPKNLVLQ